VSAFFDAISDVCLLPRLPKMRRVDAQLVVAGVHDHVIAKKAFACKLSESQPMCAPSHSLSSPFVAHINLAVTGVVSRANPKPTIAAALRKRIADESLNQIRIKNLWHLFSNSPILQF